MRYILALVLLTTCLTAPPLSAQTQRGPGAPTLDETLPNGLRLVVYEDHRAPTALHMVWVKAGSMDEVNGKTGLAHVLEHMMFKGTKTLAPGEFSQRVAALGGRENAFTSREYTAYFQQVHKDALFEVMALEADRMQNLSISQEEFAKEIQVVMEERRLRTEDSPNGRANEALMAHAFMSSPVRYPVIGWMSDLESLTVQDARDWYATWYAPNNATVIVAGDVDAKAVRAEVVRLYAAWAKRELPTRRPQNEPDQLGERALVVAAPAANPFFIRAWRSPSLSAQEAVSTRNPKAREMAALAVLSSLLDSPDLGRLTIRLVQEKRLALSVSADAADLSRGPGLFMIEGTPSEGVSLLELEKNMVLEIQKIAQEGIPESELAIIRRQVRASRIFQQDSLFSRAMEAGRLITADRPLSDSADWITLLDDIRSDDVQRVAASIFRADQSTRVELRPLPLSDAPKRSASSAALRH